MQIIDFDPTFRKNSENGINYIYDNDVIKQSLKILLITKVKSFVRYHLPHFGCNLNSLIGKKINNVIADQIKTVITTSIENYMSKIKLRSVDVNQVDKTIMININYYITNFDTDDTLELKFQVLK